MCQNFTQCLAWIISIITTALEDRYMFINIIIPMLQIKILKYRDFG